MSLQKKIKVAKKTLKEINQKSETKHNLVVGLFAIPSDSNNPYDHPALDFVDIENC